MLNDTQFVIQDPIFVTQFQELAHYFCNIQNELLELMQSI